MADGLWDTPRQLAHTPAFASSGGGGINVIVSPDGSVLFTMPNGHMGTPPGAADAILACLAAARGQQAKGGADA